MAWDKDRPYAPFWNHTDVWPERYGSMDSYGNGDEVTAEMIDAMYADGVYIPPMVKRWNRKTEQYEECHPSYVWRPFKEVELTLTFCEYTRGRSSTVFWWKDDEGHKYPMFVMEVERLLLEDKLRKTISGKWSAEKRGANYGIRLVGEVA
jgi:hypothetical protein